MAIINALKTGNWSDPTVWPGGILPGASDQVQANGYTITINMDIAVASLRTTAEGGGIAGGTFLCAAGPRQIIGNIVAGTGIGITVSSSFSGLLQILGDISGGGSNAHGLNSISSSLKLEVTGNITGGYAYGAKGLSGTAVTVAVIGSAVGGPSGDYYNSGVGISCSILSVSGGVSGGAGILSGGIHISGAYGAQITIGGDITASLSSPGVSVIPLSCVITCNGLVPKPGVLPIISDATSAVNFSSAVIGYQLQPFGIGTYIPEEISSIIFGEDIFISEESLCEYPAAADVRENTPYGAGGAYEGTLSVPPAGSVLVGVPVDATVGSASVSEEALTEIIQSAMTSYIFSPGEGQTPPLIPVPSVEDVAMIYMDCWDLSLQLPLSVITPTVKIISLPHVVGGKAAQSAQNTGTYNAETGRWSCEVAPGAKVRVRIPEIGLDHTGFVGAALSVTRADLI